MHVRHFKHASLFESFPRLLSTKKKNRVEGSNLKQKQQNKGQETNLLSAQFKRQRRTSPKGETFQMSRVASQRTKADRKGVAIDHLVARA